MSDAPWFRVNAVLDIAIRYDTHAPPAEFQRPTWVPRSDRARAAVARLSSWDEPDVREACSALLEAIVGLERDLQRMAQEGTLEKIGVSLKSTLVGIGGDGMTVHRSNQWRPGTALQAWIDLPVRSNRHMLCVPAIVMPSEAGITELRFVNPGADMRDLIVAFGFEQQARERRRALDSA